MTSVWTDDQTSFLRIGCDQKGKAVWGVISNTWNISEELKEEILEEVAKYGFDVSNPITLNYEGCELEIKSDVIEGTCAQNVPKGKGINPKEVSTY